MRLPRQLWLITTLLIVVGAACSNTTRESTADTRSNSPSDLPMLEAGDHTISLTHDGRDRSYIIHIPPDMTLPAPVVMALHGGGGTGKDFQEQNGLDAVAHREGFVAVYPEGTGRFSGRLHTWNSGDTCCGYAYDNEVDDVGFLRRVVEDLDNRVDTDPSRLYVTGHSNGAMMTYRFAAEAPELVGAIVAVAGAPDFDISSSATPVPLLHIHSKDDPRATYEGGDGPPFPGTDRVVYHAPVRPGIEAWATAINGCDPEPDIGETAAGSPPNDGQTITRMSWRNCSEGGAVEHLVLTGSGHGWPSVELSRIWQSQLGPATTIINTSEEIWAFASQHSRVR